MSSLNSVDQSVPFHDTASIKFNYIRFPQYRIACKLRDFQKISKFTLIDQFNTVESFREYGLNGIPDLNCKFGLAQVYNLLSYVFEQLSQRLPVEQSKTVSVEQCSRTVFNFVRDILDPSTSGSVNVFDLKILLTLLCQSVYSNKLRYIYTLISESFATMSEGLDRFLSTISAIVTYFEGDSVNLIIDQEFTVADQNDFVEKFSDESPESQSELTSWLVVYHRLPEVEAIHHEEACSACKCTHFFGFRYKCMKDCSHYILCQECFWSGKSTGTHNPDKHPCKEYMSDKKALRASLRRSFRSSFRLKPKKPVPRIGPASEVSSDKKFNMSNIITSPMAKRRQVKTNFDYKFQDYHKSPIKIAVQSDEHTTIKHYLSIINEKTQKPPPLDVTNSMGSEFEKTIQELESRNNYLMSKIAVMKCRKQNAQTQESKEAIYEDLNQLRQKQSDLELHLNGLQNRRQILMMQLDEVMKSLSVSDPSKSSTDHSFNDSSPMSNSSINDYPTPSNEFVHL